MHQNVPFWSSHFLLPFSTFRKVSQFCIYFLPPILSCTFLLTHLSHWIDTSEINTFFHCIHDTIMWWDATPCLFKWLFEELMKKLCKGEMKKKRQGMGERAQRETKGKWEGKEEEEVWWKRGCKNNILCKEGFKGRNLRCLPAFLCLWDGDWRRIYIAECSLRMLLS